MLRTSLLILFIGTLGLGVDCSLLSKVVLVEKNTNVLTESFFTYSQTSFRALSNYEAALGKDFLAGVPAQGVWIDLGSGVGVATLERALKKNSPPLQIIAVNKQPFQSEVLDYLNGLVNAPSLFFSRTTSLNSKKENETSLVAIEGRRNFNQLFPILARALEVPIPQGKEDLSEAAVRDFLKTLSQKISAAEANGLKNVSNVLVEDFLKANPVAADRISDTFGAFYYSPDRLKLLPLVYKNLKPGGQARFAFDGLLKADVVIGDKSTPLLSWLQQTYPEQITVTGSGDNLILILNRPKHLDTFSPDLTFKGVIPSEPTKKYGGFCFAGISCADSPNPPHSIYHRDP